MILQELLGIKKYTDDTITAFLNRMVRDKKIKVRNGSFAFVVIPEDTAYVYKVWTHDDGWWEYLEYIGDHPNNEHLLRTKGRIKKIKFTFKRPEDFDTDLHVIKLEKLAELETNDEAYGQVRGLMLYLRKYDVHKLNKEDIPEIQAWIQEKEFVKPPPASFIETVLDVLQSSAISSNDFHTGNVMLRGNTLVITDPYYVPEGGRNIKISAADLSQGKYYGQHSERTKSGR